MKLDIVSLNHEFKMAKADLFAARGAVVDSESKIFELEALIKHTHSDHHETKAYKDCKNDKVRDAYIETLIPEHFRDVSERKLELIQQKVRLRNAETQWDHCRYALRLLEAARLPLEEAA